MRFIDEKLANSENFVIFKPAEFYNIGTEDGRQNFLYWIEDKRENGYEFISMLPTGLALFKVL